ncbi:MAG: hypothetical protein P4K93_08945 [Terracidiphilus sp.]|nr:hypothetical protein [Terracidiphilus sp.]MDR3798266.1 hypothetical protein [Terracidiphilus sp.]
MMRNPIKSIVVFLVVLSTAASKPQNSNEKIPTFEIKGPTIITYFREISQAELDRGEGDAEAASDYSYYLHNVEGRMESSGITLKSILGAHFRVKIGNKVLDVRDNGVGVGYYFITPGKAPRLEKGVMTDEDLVLEARKYFGMKIR